MPSIVSGLDSLIDEGLGLLAIGTTAPHYRHLGSYRRLAGTAAPALRRACPGWRALLPNREELGTPQAHRIGPELALAVELVVRPQAQGV